MVELYTTVCMCVSLACILTQTQLLATRDEFERRQRAIKDEEKKGDIFAMLKPQHNLIPAPLKACSPCMCIVVIPLSYSHMLYSFSLTEDEGMQQERKELLTKLHKMRYTNS